MAYTRRDFDQDIYNLVSGKTFLAHCIAQINRQATESLPTAAIGFDKERNKFTMWYNPQFMSELSSKHRRGVILHELFHFINHHITTRMPERKYMKIWNYATDLAINDHIKDQLPEFCLVPGRGPFADLSKFPHNQTADFYFDILKEEQDELEEQLKQFMQEAEDAQDGQSGEGGSGNSFFDDHGEWLTDPDGDGNEGTGNNGSHEIAKQKAKQILQKAVNEANKKGTSEAWGHVSAEMREKIMASLKPQINWKSVLRQFVQASQRANKRNSVMRINRRKPYMRPGKRQNYVANILVAVDMSGSVSDDLLCKFFAEIDGLAKHATFTVAPFDTQVLQEHVYTQEKGRRGPKERVYCGGTCFQAPTSYVNEHKEYDALIVLTDLLAPAPGPSRVRRMWLTNEEHAKNIYFDPATLNERLLVVK